MGKTSLWLTTRRKDLDAAILAAETGDQAYKKKVFKEIAKKHGVPINSVEQAVIRYGRRLQGLCACGRDKVDVDSGVFLCPSCRRKRRKGAKNYQKRLEEGGGKASKLKRIALVVPNKRDKENVLMSIRAISNTIDDKGGISVVDITNEFNRSHSMHKESDVFTGTMGKWLKNMGFKFGRRKNSNGYQSLSVILWDENKLGRMPVVGDARSRKKVSAENTNEGEARKMAKAGKDKKVVKGIGIQVNKDGISKDGLCANCLIDDKVDTIKKADVVCKGCGKELCVDHMTKHLDKHYH